MTEPAPNPARRRRSAWVALVLAIAVLFAIVFSQVAFNLSFLRPDSNEQTLIFAALSGVIFLLLVTLTFILLRNLLRLFAERRLGVIGSKFRTRMVVGALLLSLTPAIFLFLFAYALMNRSIDKWFSRPVEEVREDTAEVASLLASYAAKNADAEAQSLAQQPETLRSFSTGNFAGVLGEFRRRETTLEGGFALALVNDGRDPAAPLSSTRWSAEASFRAPQPWALLRPQLAEAQTRGTKPAIVEVEGVSYALGTARAGENGRILVALPLPAKFTSTLARIEASQRRYYQLAAERKLVRRTYMGYLLLLTMLVLFVATWFALFLSKLVTRPVAALAEATQEISRGRLDYRVHVPAAAELGDLVASFNLMASQLESSRQQIESSSHDLAEANTRLEQRRRQIETILENIPTGVLSLDAARRVTHANDAFLRMFPADNGRAPLGRPVRELFAADVAADLDHLLRKADRMATTTSQVEITTPGSRLNAAVTVASLTHDRQRLGYVIVFEDLSDVLMAQKQAAWREVARRVAHEIKNPLTPIALSAERIRRHLERSAKPDAESLGIIRSCAETIAGAVETMRGLVDEFATLARFPSSRPQPASLNGIVESALAMFDGRLEGVGVQTFLAQDLPPVMADAQAMKRAVANLIDNAAEAMQDSLVREIHISTSLVGNRDAVELVVADSGHGVSPEVKEKLFMPYFSTKRRGTGLGLAIVSRIVEEHRGSIRVEENRPIGTRFIVELPLVAEAAATPQTAAADSHA